MRDERRNSIRYLAREDVTAVLRDGFTKIGRVKDISMTGMCFEHINDYDEDANRNVKREILFLVDGFSLPRLFGKVVYEIPVHMPEEFRSFPTRFKTRRCGVEFEPLSAEQAMPFEFFLKTYTMSGGTSSP